MITYTTKITYTYDKDGNLLSTKTEGPIETSKQLITDDDILNSITKPLCIFGSYMQHTGKVIMVKDKHFFLSVKSHGNFSAFNKVTIQDLYSEVIN